MRREHLVTVALLVIASGCEPSAPAVEPHIVMPAPLEPTSATATKRADDAPKTNGAVAAPSTPTSMPTSTAIALDVAALMRGGDALAHLPEDATEPKVPFDPGLRSSLAPTIRVQNGGHAPNGPPGRQHAEDSFYDF